MQQLFRLLTFFNSALHVSGDKFAHPQEHFLTVYTAFGTMQRHCCRPVPRLRWNSVKSYLTTNARNGYNDINNQQDANVSFINLF